VLAHSQKMSMVFHTENYEDARTYSHKKKSQYFFFFKNLTKISGQRQIKRIFNYKQTSQFMIHANINYHLSIFPEAY
jgi:hypothetical protein